MRTAAALTALCLAAASAPCGAAPSSAPAACERLGEPAPEDRALLFRAALPPPLPGWVADAAEAGSGPGALLGGGPSASRRYSAAGNPEKTVDVEVVAESLLVDSLAPLLADPVLLAQTPGSTVIDVKGRRALRRLAADDHTAEVSLVLGARGLVVVRGLGVEGAYEVTAYAEALDYEALEGLLRP